jgi:hypothetical protein
MTAAVRQDDLVDTLIVIAGIGDAPGAAHERLAGAGYFPSHGIADSFQSEMSGSNGAGKAPVPHRLAREARPADCGFR